jgi:serine/threonine protein kinase
VPYFTSLLSILKNTMFEDQFLKYKAENLAVEENFDIQDALEKPESIFVETELPEKLLENALLVYEKILTKEDSILGSGNVGIVFKESDRACIKCLWDTLTIEIKHKKFQMLSPKHQQLRRVYDYFEEIKSKKRNLSAAGAQFGAENGPLKEAGLQIVAQKILAEKGLERMVPGLNGVIELSEEDEGEIEGLPYEIREKVYLISMQTVDGVNLEELILNYDEYPDLLEIIDFNYFKKMLLEGLDILHEAGLCHKDLSIRNIMIDRKTGEPRLIDFGKSKKTDSNSPECSEENEAANNVLVHLKQLLNDPESKKNKLASAFKKFEQKF